MARRGVWIAAALALLVAGCASNPITAAAQTIYQPCPATEFWGVWWSPDGARLGLLFYQRGREAQLGVLTLGGAGFTPLASQIPGGKSDARWSPDSQQILFTSRASNNFNLYIASAHGGTVRQLTTRLQNDVTPSWSPDGSRLAYVSLDGRAEPHHRIYLSQADGSGETLLEQGSALVSDLSWSPDGTRLAYLVRTGRGAIVTIRPDGSGQTQVTDGQGDDQAPAWSPDSQQLAFRSYRNHQNGLYIIQANGSGLRLLTNDIDERSRPAWLPDGRHVSFVSHGPDQRLMVIDVDTLATEQLTWFPVEEYFNPPSWSADGSKVAFVAYDHSNPNMASMDIYVMNRDGSGLARVTDNPGKRMCLEWPF